VGAELFHADRKTLTIAFLNFAKATKVLPTLLIRSISRQRSVVSRALAMVFINYGLLGCNDVLSGSY
jgi:hypothetical protein